MVSPLPNTTANWYCNYPRADTYLKSVTECKYDLFNLWSSRSSWRTRWLISTLYLWCWQMSQAAIASHYRRKESLFQEGQMEGMLLWNHIKCGTCLEYFFWLLPLSDVSPALVDLHNTRQPRDQHKPWVSDMTCSRTDLICEAEEWSATSTRPYVVGSGKQLLLPVLLNYLCA